MSDHEEDPMLRTSATLGATSAVGFTRAEENRENGVMTSRCDENLLRTLLATQNENMMALIEAIKGPAGTKHISLPEFDPDKPEVDARAWCTTADLCLSEAPLQGSALIIALSKALKGSASRWLAQVSFAGMTWCNFKSLFLSRYDCVDTPAATLVKLMSSKPKESECYAAYAARLLATLTSRWQNMSAKQIAISTVLAHMAQFDGRIQRLAFTTEVSNRNKLQCELQAFSFSKRKANGNATDTAPDFKRAKFQPSTLICHNCGKPGHRASDCRSRGEVKSKATSAATSASTSAGSKQRPDVICFRCGNVGYFATKCPRSNGGSNSATRGSSSSESAPATASSSARRVEVCHVSNPSGVLINSGSVYQLTAIDIEGCDDQIPCPVTVGHDVLVRLEYFADFVSENLDQDVTFNINYVYLKTQVTPERCGISDCAVMIANTKASLTSVMTVPSLALNQRADLWWVVENENHQQVLCYKVRVQTQSPLQKLMRDYIKMKTARITQEAQP